MLTSCSNRKKLIAKTFKAANTLDMTFKYDDEMTITDNARDEVYYAKITTDKTEYIIGETIVINYEFKNKTNKYFYNPLFNSEAPIPATLAFFDCSKNYIADEFFFGFNYPERPPKEIDWIYMPCSSKIGKEIKISACPPNFCLNSVLPGDYYIQLIYFKAFLSSKPKNNAEIDKFLDTYNKQEIFRSNCLKLKFKIKDNSN